MFSTHNFSSTEDRASDLIEGTVFTFQVICKSSVRHYIDTWDRKNHPGWSCTLYNGNVRFPQPGG